MPAAASTAPSRAKIRTASFRQLCLFLFAGTVVPALVYTGSRSGALGWLWELPPHRGSKVAIAGALALAASLSALSLVRHLDRNPSRRWVARTALPIAAVLAAGAACFHWQYAGPGGDARYWVRLASHPFIMSSEPFGRWSQYLTYRALAVLGNADPSLAVRLSSVLAGSFYLAGLIGLVPRAFPRSSAWALVVFLFVTPTAELFAGHPETTPWVFALTGVYLLAGIRYLGLESTRPPWIESLVLMLALWAHGMACFATGAHAVLVLRWLFGGDRGRGRALRSPRRVLTALGLALLPFVALGATMAWAHQFGSGLARSPWYGNALGGGGGQWVAFSETASHVDVQYVFLDSRHLTDLANLFLLACPLLILLPAVYRQLAHALAPQLAFLGGALGGLLLFTLFWNADLGMERDFDLMAMFSIPAHVTVALWLDARFSGRQQQAAVLATASAVFSFRLVPFLNFP